MRIQTVTKGRTPKLLGRTPKLLGSHLKWHVCAGENLHSIVCCPFFLRNTTKYPSLPYLFQRMGWSPLHCVPLPHQLPLLSNPVRNELSTSAADGSFIKPHHLQNPFNPSSQTLFHHSSIHRHHFHIQISSSLFQHSRQHQEISSFQNWV